MRTRSPMLSGLASLLVLTLTLAACQPGQTTPTYDAKGYAQKLIADSGKKDVTITRVLEGNKDYKRADALWCVETDADNADGTLPYLLAVWQKGGAWEGTEMKEGFYEWDLYGCPR